MKFARRILAGLLLTSVGLTGTAAALERHHYPGTFCVPESGGGLRWERPEIQFEVGQLAYCPVLTLKNTSIITDVLVFTSTGVSSSEIALLEVDQDGDLVQLRSPEDMEAVSGTNIYHFEANLDPNPNTNVISIRVGGANGDKIHGYVIEDSELSY